MEISDFVLCYKSANARPAQRTNIQVVTASRAEKLFHIGGEFIKQVIRNKRLYCTCKAASVYAAGTPAVQDALGGVKSQNHALFADA